MSSTPNYSLASNLASAPLPLIPRRAATRANTVPAPSSVTPPRSSSPVKVVIHGPSPSRESAKTSTDYFSPGMSSAPGGSIPRVKKSRKSPPVLPTLCPPELSTPTPAAALFNSSNSQPPLPVSEQDDTPRASSSTSSDKPLIYQPGVSLRINLDGLKNRTLSDTRIDGLPGASLGSDSFPIPPTIEAQLVRKKSGQLVKSSLKRSKSTDRGSLSIFTCRTPSKSEPTTPKAVHFDAKLEHVKLFLAEQKPLAVSRDGSPTDDTSGTESDFPSFIYGSSEERNARRHLSMKVTNMPLLVNPNHDVALEELKLASDMLSIEGRVRLRNISYHKLLAVRFTFDAWQTTSEVMGKYSESINNDFDRFTFSIRLNDLLARIDGKTLLLALRYNTDGREIWDNNSHQNYHAVFSTKRPSKSKDDDSSASDVADLKTRLEKVAKTREDSLKTPTRRSGSRSNSSSSSSSDSDKPLEFKTSGSLASRYDLGSSLRAPWKSPAASYPIPRRHSRTLPTPPVSAPASSIPWPEKITTKGYAPSSKSKAELGSPRDLSDEERYRILGSPRIHSASRETENIPFPVMNPVPSKDQRSSRIHQRGGYFDIGPKEGLIVKMTPPSSPQSSSIALPSPRSISFPPTDGSLPRSPLPAPASLDISSRVGLRIQTSNSEDSTPTFISSSGSSRSSTPSPVDSFSFNSLAGPFGETTTSPAGAPVDYHQLIDKFCFYTGVDNLPARSASVSSIDDIFTTQSPRIYGLNSIFNSPPLTTRSNSDDAIVCRSGSATPIAIRTPTPGSRSPTPIAA